MDDGEQGTREQLAKLEKQIESLEALRGVLPDVQIEEMKAGLLQERARLVQTAGGAYVEGDVIQAQVVVKGDGAQVWLGEKGDDPAELRAAYLSRVVESAGALSLAGIDPKAAGEANPLLSLAAVYTALMTLESEAGERLGRAGSGAGSPERQRRLSALELLDRQARLVLLGDPGSGKSTFVNFVALCLAGEALGRSDANLALLTRPLPLEDDQGEAEQPTPQPWRHAALLPLRITLRDFAARGLPAVGEAGRAKHLWDFIADELERAALGAFTPHLLRELRETGGLLLLDGLDEAPEADTRRAQIKQAIEDFGASFRKVRLLVTSRTYAYQKQEWRLQQFSEAVLAPFSAGQMRQFIRSWYAHIAGLRGLQVDDAQGRAALLERAIFNSDRLQGLAERPLLLTLIASLHAWRGGSLPEQREALYADAVDLLLDWWESPKVVRNARGEMVVAQPSLAEWLKTDRQKVRSLLNRLAFEAHAAQPDLQGTADIAESGLVTGLLELSQNPDARPGRLVEYLATRAGLLLPRGVGIYTFPHRTFQEYLAACYLTEHDYPELAAELACKDFNRWREAVLLAGAKAGRGTPASLWALVDALCFQDISQDASPLQTGDETLWGAHLAGLALAEAGEMLQISPRNQPKLRRVQDGLLAILRSGRLPALERCRAGDSLGRLGDPRFDARRWFLPDEPTLGFVCVPGGPFRMGSDPQADPGADEDEQPQHTLELPEFWIARCPVTVAQFGAYFADSGLQPKDPDSLRGLPNRPAVWVYWDEALAYCRWLNGRLVELAQAQLAGDPAERDFWQALASGRLAATLPSEAEWEKAARGAQAPIYPWGNDFDPNCANTGATGIGMSSAVGCFPGGASPYGALDMSGNVWEWTRTLWGTKYPYDPADGREDLQATGARVVRGGSFNHDAGFVRCAFRLRLGFVYRYDLLGFRPALLSPLPLGSGNSETLGL